MKSCYLIIRGESIPFRYVFLMESASLEYEVTQNCNLTRVGNIVLGSNGYSIALPKGPFCYSSLREEGRKQSISLEIC